MTAKSDGKQLSPALGIGGFCTHTVVSAKQAVPVPRECPPEQACLLGCGVTTGVGAALYTGGVRRGSTVAVYGCGGVGCSVIMGAKLANAKTIIGVDIADNKLAWAKDFGATHVVDATKVTRLKRSRRSREATVSTTPSRLSGHRRRCCRRCGLGTWRGRAR